MLADSIIWFPLVLSVSLIPDHRLAPDTPEPAENVENEI